MAKSELEQYREYVAAQLSKLSPLLQSYALGDFSDTIEIPEEEDEFTELLVGLSLMVDDIREMIQEKESSITKLERAEEETAEAKAYLESSLASIPEGVLLLDEQARFTYVNPAFLEWLGREAEDFIGKTVPEISPPVMTPETTKIIAERAKRRVKTGEPIAGAEVEIIGKDGKPIAISYSAAGIKNERGDVLGEVVFLKDITEFKRAEETRKQAEEELRQHRDHLEELVEERTAELTRQSEIISRQAQEILEISTPVLQVWEGVVVAPLIGVLDSQRTQRFMEVLLERIVETQSPIALVDITGVPTVDTQTAYHLIETISAVRLLGAQVVLTGVSPAIAQALVHLGVDLSGIVTRSSLVAGLRVALELLGLRMVGKE
jgi:PAS domain S-box-containing protein